MSGLAHYFSGPKPHQTSGAMANNMGTGRYTTPARRHSSFRSPAVSARASRIIPEGKISHAFARTTQAVPLVQATRRRVSTPIPANGRQRVFRPHSAQAGANWQEQTPRPTNSLISRMALSAVLVARPSDKWNNMKSVDLTKDKFRKRFSGSISEDWMAHVDALELDMAKKHGWTARQFFYGLKETLQGAALEELISLQTDLHQPDLAPLIPDWYECETQELMGILRDRITFSGLSERTQLAIIIVHFFRRFQQDTPQTAYDDFLYSAQEPSESIESWGDRLNKMVMKLSRFGIQISFDDYLEQWSTGTKDGAFSSKLDEAITADDPNKLPVIYDYASFVVWYNRYKAKNLSKKKKLQRRSRLLAIHNMRQKASGPKKGDGRPKSKTPNTNKLAGHSGRVKERTSAVRTN